MDKLVKFFPVWVDAAIKANPKYFLDSNFTQIVADNLICMERFCTKLEEMH